MGFVGMTILHQLFISDPQQAVFFLALIIVLSVFYVNKKTEERQRLQVQKTETDKWLTNTKRRELGGRHYQVYRHVKNTKYSYRIKEYKDIMDKLEFLYIYDDDQLNHVKSVCENFFKTHFNIMMGKYDPQLFITELHDFKQIALDLMREFVFVTPQISSIVDIPNIDVFLEEQTNKLNELLSRYIRIVSHAYPKVVVKRSYEPPFENGIAL